MNKYYLVFFKIFLLFCCYSVSGQKTLIPYLANNQWGFADTNGIIHIEPRFDTVHQFKNDMALIVLDEKKGYIDTKDSFIINPEYDYLKSIRFNEITLIYCEKNGKGVIFKKERNQLDTILELEEKIDKWINLGAGVNLYTKSTKYSINKNGDVLSKGQNLTDNNFEFELEMPDDEPDIYGSNKKANSPIIKVNDKYSVVINKSKYNKTTKTYETIKDTIIANCDSISMLSSYYTYAVKKNGLWGIINYRKKIVLPYAYDEIFFVTGGDYFVKKNGKWGIMKISRDEIKPYIEIKYDSLSYFNETYASLNYLASLNGEGFFIFKKRPNQPISIEGYQPIASHYSQSGFYLLQVQLKNGKEAFIGENGFRFFKE